MRALERKRNGEASLLSQVIGVLKCVNRFSYQTGRTGMPFNEVDDVEVAFGFANALADQVVQFGLQAERLGRIDALKAWKLSLSLRAQPVRDGFAPNRRSSEKSKRTSLLCSGLRSPLSTKHAKAPVQAESTPAPNVVLSPAPTPVRRSTRRMTLGVRIQHMK